MDIVCFGQQNWDVCWTAKQHLMTRLARRGNKILFVDPMPAAAGGTRLSRWRGFALRQEEPGLWILTFHDAALLGRRLNSRRNVRILRRLIRRLGMVYPISLVFTPYKRWLANAILPSARVYFAVDEWTGFGGLTDEQRRWLREQENALLREADVALAVSPRLLERFRIFQPRAYLQENAVDVDHFAPARVATAPPHPQVATLPRPRVGFVGQVDERLDQDLLLSLATARPHWQIVLAGRIKDEVDVSALRRMSNIHLLGYQPYDQLPGVLREIDVCMVPYRLTDLTQSCNPLKVYEYLATGLPVVSTPLAGLNTARGVVSPASSPEEFLAAIEAAIADPASDRDNRLRVASENTWEHRVDLLEQRLEEALHFGLSRQNRPRPRTYPGSGAGDLHLRLDARDDSQRQLNQNFARGRLSLAQQLFFHATRLAGWAYYLLRLVGRILKNDRPIAVQKILVVRRCQLGDLVAFLPTLSALRRRFPKARIVLGAGPNMSAAELLAGSSDIDEIRVLDFMSAESRTQRLRGAWSLFKEGFDVMISGVSYFLIRDASFCGAPFRIGLYDGHPLQKLNSRVIMVDANRHEVDNNLALAEALGCHAATDQRSPRVTVSSCAVPLVRSRNIPAEATIITIHPGSKRPSRRWPLQNFIILIERLLAGYPKRHVVLSGVLEEQPLVNSIIEGLPREVRDRAHSAIGQTNLPSLIELLKDSTLVICNDTGIMHVARALGRPLLALLGPENDRRWGPYAFGLSPAISLRHIVPCAPCVRWEAENHYCMRSLTAEQVIRAAEELLAPDDPTITPVYRREAQHNSWAHLAQGFEIPRVSVLLLGPVDASKASDLNDSINRQDYPNMTLVEAGDAEKLGDFVTVIRPGERWERGKISEDVASLVRSPHAAARGQRVWDLSQIKVSDLPSSITYRRNTWLEVRHDPQFRSA